MSERERYKNPMLFTYFLLHMMRAKYKAYRDKNKHKHTMFSSHFITRNLSITGKSEMGRKQSKISFNIFLWCAMWKLQEYQSYISHTHTHPHTHTLTHTHTHTQNQPPKTRYPTLIPFQIPCDILLSQYVGKFNIENEWDKVVI